jgi:hypothetical protein
LHPGPAFFHPLALGVHDVEAVEGGRGGIDIGRGRPIIERDPEHLADLLGLHGELAGRIDQPRVLRAFHVLEIEDDQRVPVAVDEEVILGIAAGGRAPGNNAGESGDHRVAERHARRCRRRCALRRGWCGQRERRQQRGDSGDDRQGAEADGRGMVQVCRSTRYLTTSSITCVQCIPPQHPAPQHPARIWRGPELYALIGSSDRCDLPAR